MENMGAQTISSPPVTDMIQPDASQEQTPQPQPTQPGQPAQAQPNQPASAQPQPQPQRPRKNLFDRVLEGVAGGPTRVTDPRTGITQELPMTKKSISAHILAGAITGIISGAAASASAPAGPAGTNTPANMAALGAGFQGYQQKEQQIRQAPQQRVDEEQMRRAAALKNNLSELQNQVAIDKLHDEDWASKENYYQSAQDIYQPLLQAFEESDKALAPGQQSLLVDRGLSHDEAMQKLQGNSSNLQAIQDGWTTQESPDGKTYHTPTFALVRTGGSVNVNRDALTTLAQYDSRLANALAKNSDTSLQFTPTFLMSLEKNAQQGLVAENFINNIRHGLGLEDIQGFNSAYRDDPVLRGQVDGMVSMLGSLGTHSTASALEELMQSGKGSKLMKFFGKSPDELEKFVQDKKNAALQEQSEAKSAGAIKVAQIKTSGKPMTDNLAASILSDPNSAPVDRARAEAFHNIQAKWKENQERNKAEIDRSAKVGDPKIAARLLYEGTLTLSELKARSSDAKFITEVTNDAQQMARAGGDPNWTPQTGESYFKAAQTPANQQFFGNVDSLLAKDGTLAQLSDWYNKLGNVQFPILNKWEDYLAYQAGEEKAGTAMAGFAQTALAVADDYAKVMGGAVGTDTARMDILKRMANAHNPAQWAAVMNAVRAGIKSQAAGRIGHNPVLQQMYGDNVPENRQRASRPTQPLNRTVPAGKFAARDQQGNIVGYADDASGTNFTRF